MSGTLLVTFADMHINSTTGLCPPTVRLDDGGYYYHSQAQLHDLWEPWNECLEYVKKRARELKARVVVICNGDGPDLLSHCHHQLVTMNRAVVVRMACDVLEPWRKIADVMIINRGTQAHSGGSGELEELVARELGANECPDNHNSSWWWVNAVFDGVRVEAGHRPISNSTREHLRGAGARRVAADRWMAYTRMGDTPPDLAIFSHVHHWADSGSNYPTRVFFTFPWQLCTAYGYNVGFGRKQDPVGAWLFHCDKGRYTVDNWQRQPTLPKWHKL